MSWKKSEAKKAALVLAHDERQTKKSTIIIPILRTVVNGTAAGLIGLSIAMLIVIGVAAFAAAFLPALVLAITGDRI